MQRSCPTGHIKAMKYMKGQNFLQLPYCAEHCRCESSYLPDVMMPHVEVPVRQQVGCDNMVSAGCLVPTVVKSIDFIISEVWKNPFEAGQVLMQQKSSKMPRVATSYSDCDTG